ncbi:fructokinase [Arboricoccus pini]|uniref:Fructokinase n=1 Tax=Arboricoccus pini TaxID=1963835 RepID=A0A212PW11_9PROT|nr:PfkB family carbohydrate kinase [Arboricoccus pini]SNB51100.1 fructokinase [Arboricoccus pini]
MADIICFGDLLIDFVPTQTGTGLIDAPAFKKAPGGAAANVAVGLARLGVASAFMGKVGNDPFGHFLAQTLEAEGVDIRPLRFDPTARTSLAFVSLREDGEREFLFYRENSADQNFRVSEIDKAAIEAARIFHFDSISLAAERARGTTLAAADIAADAGLTISYDVNLRPALWADLDAARPTILAGLRRASIVKLSEEELAFLAANGDLERACQQLWHPAMKLLIVTRGAEGCTVVTERCVSEITSIAVTPVDTTGAGDGFVAGLLQGLVGGDAYLEDDGALRELCRFANAVGALTTTERGAIPALPRRDAVLAALARAE